MSDRSASSESSTALLSVNVDRLVATVTAGQIANPLVRGSPYRVGRDGVLHVVPGTGGIVLNRRVGDRAVGLAGDHIEPGVALHNNDREVVGPPGAANRGMMLLSCVGNRVSVSSGPATGAHGTVTGKHGGINHVLVDFEPAVLKRLRIGDRMRITAYGQGLRLLDFPTVTALNLSPRLLARWGIRPHGPHLHVPVTHVVPSGIMGSGLGKSDGVLGDCDIQISDPIMRRRFRLGALRFGDLVAVCGLDNRFGPTVRGGRITVGVIVHSDSNVAGHGPGVTPLLMGSARVLRPFYAPNANIAFALGLRRQLAPVRQPDDEERRTVWRQVARCPAPGVACPAPLLRRRQELSPARLARSTW
jgi:Domain of unknown function (DUF4438)